MGKLIQFPIKKEGLQAGYALWQASNNESGLTLDEICKSAEIAMKQGCDIKLSDILSVSDELWK